VPGKSRTEQLNAQIEECVIELGVRMVGQAEKLAQQLSIPLVFLKALHTLDAPMAMKELGKRLHCDPSFVTAVADMLEKRGLARREPHPGDRRIKNLVLTGEGCDLKQRLEAELTARMPWNRGLNDDERAQLLALIRKMLSADAPAGEPGEAECVTFAPDSLVASPLSQPMSQPMSQPTMSAGPTSPPAPAGEVNIGATRATG
jgi:DNA-binding MarR family transcriptional regulator